jgi:hypothetical protein
MVCASGAIALFIGNFLGNVFLGNICATIDQAGARPDFLPA